MAILRNKTQNNFTIITNNILRDERLPMNARGLLCTMLSLPDNWEFSERGLQAILPGNGLSAIKSALKVLQECGYLRRSKIRGKGGTFGGWQWELTNEPNMFNLYDSPRCDFPTSDNPTLEKPTSENHDQLSTESIKTVSIKDEKKERKKAKAFIPPTLEEIRSYIAEMGYGLDPEEFLDSNEQTGWKTKSGQQVSDWQARVRMFERNRRKWTAERSQSTEQQSGVMEHTKEENALSFASPITFD